MMVILVKKLDTNSYLGQSFVSVYIETSGREKPGNSNIIHCRSIPCYYLVLQDSIQIFQSKS